MASLENANVFGVIRLTGLRSECVADSTGVRTISRVATVNGARVDGTATIKVPGFTV